MAQVEEPGPSKHTEALTRLLEINSELLAKTGQLEGALQSRIVIEQAKGILAARYDVDLQTAFEALRRGARSHHLKLRELAQTVVDEKETPREVGRYLGD
jgi:AmiR/NasT family two-component response regulator